MQFNSLTIENFRGMNLKIDDFKHINLLVGRNNCGKTSILESIFLLAGMSNPQLPLNIHHFRDLQLLDDEDFNYMFSNLDFEVPIVLKGQVDKKNRQLKITPLYTDYELQPPSRQKSPVINDKPDTLTGSANLVRLVEGIKLEFKNEQGKSFRGQLSFKGKGALFPATYKETLKCAFLNPRTMSIEVDKRLGGLLIQKKLSTVIEVLKEIEPRIADIRMGPGSMIYVDLGTERLLPLNIMGDGMRRILAILVAIADMKNGVLLIDEIENGFHYTSLKVLWNAIIAACKEYNVQLVATTHSYECIEALSTASQQTEPHTDEIRLFRIDRKDDIHKAYKFTAPAIFAGIEKEFEVR